MNTSSCHPFYSAPPPSSDHHHKNPYTQQIRILNSIHASNNANTVSTTTPPIKGNRGIQPTLILSLLHSYTRAGLMQEAHTLFNAMPERTQVSWTILMSGYTLHGPAVKALSLFQELSAISLRPDPFIFSAVLRACSLTGSLDYGMALHCSIVKLCCMEDLFVANALVTMYAGCGSLQYSESVFRGIQQPDLVSWSSMLSGLVKNGHREEALRLFVQMAQSGIRFDTYVLSIGLKASANIGCMGPGIQIHCSMIKIGFDSCLFLGNSLIEFYGRIGELASMRKVFDKMFDKDLVSWNTIISCYVGYLCSEEALILFRELMNEGYPKCNEFTLGSTLQAVTSLGALNHGKEIHGYVIRSGLGSNSYVISALLDMYIKCINRDTIPVKLFRHFQSLGAQFDKFIVASILKSCASHEDLETGKMIHSCIMKLGIVLDTFVISSLIDMYSKCGLLDASRQVFARIQDPGTVPWSAIIAGHCSNGQFREAMQLFRKMQLFHVRANEYTYTSAILACIALGDLRRGKEIHCNIIRTGYDSNASVVNTLINLYSDFSQLQKALNLSSSISEDEISWSSLIQSFSKVENHEKILKFFHKIQRNHGQLDHSSACCVLDSCRSPVLLNAGIQAHAYLTKRGLFSDANMSNSLLNMYSRCGTLELAIDAFNQMPDKNSTSWTLMISAHVDHGRPSKALDQFNQMIRKNMSPDSNTFVSVLKACGQMGFIDEAFRHFMSMVDVYKIKPSAEIYSSMAEVLSHAGMFREAEHFIRSVIPLEANTLVWRTLLSSCRAHGNTRIARIAAEKLVELEPNNFTANVLLKQVLLESGKWNSASKLAIRTSTTSSSWIGTRGKIVEFASGQFVAEEVSAKLMDVQRKMEEFGYVADKNHWLHTAEEEYRGESYHHTELSALAYGLVCLPRGAPVRVFKSMRMCGDCHSACKFISTFIGRDIVIRDPCKFHHFQDGRCSCKDRW